MNTVRKANVVLLYLIRNGYSDAAHTFWLILAFSRGNDQLILINWLNGTGSIDSVLNKMLFLNNGIQIINIKTAFKSLNKLMAVLPKGASNETQN